MGRDYSEYGPEIRQIAWDKFVNHGWGGDKVAKYLFEHWGVVSETDHTRPMHRNTIYNWVRKVDGSTNKTRKLRHQLEHTVAEVDLDLARRRMIELLGGDAFTDLNVQEKMMIVDRFLDVRKERSKTYDIYPDKRIRGTLTTQPGGVRPRDLNRKTEDSQAEFEAWLLLGDGFTALDERQRERIILALKTGNAEQVKAMYQNGATTEDVS